MTLWPKNLASHSEAQLDKYSAKVINDYKELLHSESIPFSDTSIMLLKQLYIPLACWASKQNDNTYILGINGAQGSGKTTFSKILKLILENIYHKHVITISLDDFYLTKSERSLLGKTIHPLLSIRGVPGTHDVSLILDFFNAISTNQFPVIIPSFDKALDEQTNKTEWKTINKKPDIILFEGWCVGALAESENSLQDPINTLEKNEDNDSLWRKYVNQQLDNDYKEIFSHIDDLISLKVPSFDMVLQWRELQEEKLRSSTLAQKNKCMNYQQLQKFIMLFERITRRMLKDTPQKSTFTLELNNDHQIESCTYNGKL